MKFGKKAALLHGLEEDFGTDLLDDQSFWLQVGQEQDVSYTTSLAATDQVQQTTTTPTPFGNVYTNTSAYEGHSVEMSLVETAGWLKLETYQLDTKSNWNSIQAPGVELHNGSGESHDVSLVINATPNMLAMDRYTTDSAWMQWGIETPDYGREVSKYVSHFAADHLFLSFDEGGKVAYQFVGHEKGTTFMGWNDVRLGNTTVSHGEGNSTFLRESLATWVGGSNKDELSSTSSWWQNGVSDPNSSKLSGGSVAQSREHSTTVFSDEKGNPSVVIDTVNNTMHFDFHQLVSQQTVAGISTQGSWDDFSLASTVTKEASPDGLALFTQFSAQSVHDDRDAFYGNDGSSTVATHHVETHQIATLSITDHGMLL